VLKHSSLPARAIIGVRSGLRTTPSRHCGGSRWGCGRHHTPANPRDGRGRPPGELRPRASARGFGPTQVAAGGCLACLLQISPRFRRAIIGVPAPQDGPWRRYGGSQCGCGRNHTPANPRDGRGRPPGELRPRMFGPNEQVAVLHARMPHSFQPHFSNPRAHTQNRAKSPSFFARILVWVWVTAQGKKVCL
jgi:hypothetical protein